MFLSDGIPTVDIPDTIPEALQAKIDGIQLMIVVAEADPENLMYKAIASDPDDANIFAVPRFSGLAGLVSEVSDALCDGRWITYNETDT